MAEAHVVMVPGWQARLHAEAMPFQSRIADDIRDDVSSDIRAHHYGTGALYGSVHKKPAHPNRVYIGTNVWRFIEYGTRPHVIEAKNTRVLASSTRVYGTRVNHPGSREFRPMRKALFTKRVLRG